MATIFTKEDVNIITYTLCNFFNEGDMTKGPLGLVYLFILFTLVNFTLLHRS
jgi:hypothetical protein